MRACRSSLRATRCTRVDTVARVIDTHCHLTFPEYEGRVDQVLADARAAGVVGAITIATTTSDAVRALALAHAHENLWSSAGVHPLYADDAKMPADWAQMRSVGLDAKCVAWGELGLDRHYDTPPHATQRAVLDEQLAHLARWRNEDAALDKPIIVHCREAFDELIPILRASALPPARFVFHCFTGGERDMRLLLDFGAYVSFTGVVTFSSARETRAAALLAPLDRVMVETDSPFLTPHPHRSTRPNEPKFVIHVAHALADLRGESREMLANTVFSNAKRFFGVLA